MKIKEMTKFIIFLSSNKIIGITLAPFGIYIKKDYLISKETINHEKIHWRQQIEMLIIFFYLWYLTEWFIRLIVIFFIWIGMIIKNSENTYDSFSELKRQAYRSISFEREAYQNDNNLDYLNNRKLYSWFKYIVKK